MICPTIKGNPHIYIEVVQKYESIARLKFDSHHLYIHAKRDSYKRWKACNFSLTNEDVHAHVSLWEDGWNLSLVEEQDIESLESSVEQEGQQKPQGGTSTQNPSHSEKG